MYTACGTLYRNLDPARHPSLEVPAAVCRTAVEDAGLATKAVCCMSSGLGNISG